MHFAFTPEQEQLQHAVRELLSRECTPAHVRAAWTGETGRVPGLWSKLAEQGVAGAMVPEAHGGLGLTELDLVLILQETGRAVVPEPIMETTAVVAPLLAELGRTDELGAIAAGHTTFSIGHESAPWVTYASEVDLLIVQRSDELHLLASKEATLTPEPSVDGSRRLSRVEGRGLVLARGDAGLRAASSMFDRAAWATAAQLIGMGRQLVDVTVAYAKVREQFGKPIGSFQAIKHHLADALVKVEFARPLVYRAAYALAHREADSSMHVSMAKSSASDAAMFAARTALQCHGAIGYAYEHDLHLWMKRAWALSAAWGDAAWHRARVGDAILNRTEEIRHV